MTSLIRLTQSSPEAQRALWHGLYSDLLAIPREVVEIPQRGLQIVFELRDRNAVQAPRFLKRWAGTVRAVSLALTAMPCLAIFFYGLARGWSLHPAVALSSLLGVMCLHSGVNLLNDVYDHLKLADLLGSTGRVGPIQRGWISAHRLRRSGFGFLAAGVLLGMPALFTVPEVILPLGALGLAGLVGYSMPPLSLKYRGLGEVLLIALVGPALCAGFSMAAFHQIDHGVLLLGGAFGFLACAVVHAKNLQLIPWDSLRGSKTLASVLGFRKAKRALPIFYFLVALSLGVGVWRGYWSWSVAALPWAISPWALRVLIKIQDASGPASPLLAGLRKASSRVSLAIGALICFGIWFL
jgi:1,4-dihydroxy-2-naphthoate octaprenyltransferase